MLLLSKVVTLLERTVFRCDVIGRETSEMVTKKIAAKVTSDKAHGTITVHSFILSNSRMCKNEQKSAHEHKKYVFTSE